MPSFTSAIAVKHQEDLADGTAVFSSTVDEEWSVNGTPHGGYLLSMVLSAIEAHQTSIGSNQLDPAHLMASFYRAARKGPITVHVKTAKKGLRWTNIGATVIQNNETLMVCQTLYTKFPPLSSSTAPFSDANINLLPLTGSPYAPLTPFLTHPSQCSTDKPRDGNRRWAHNSALWFVENPAPWSKNPEDGGSVRWAKDLGIHERMVNGAGGEERLKLEWGAWCQFTKAEDTITAKSLPLFADLMSSIPELFPPTDSSHPDTRISPSYYPTLALSMQFHAALPLSAPYMFSNKTVGCYSVGKMIHDGRHEQLVEVWSAPGPIGEGEVQEGWREKSMLLATATQIALTMDVMNMKTGIKRAVSSESKL